MAETVQSLEGLAALKQGGNETEKRVYAGAEHPHEAQQPQVVDVASMNRKNMRAA